MRALIVGLTAVFTVLQAQPVPAEAQSLRDVFRRVNAPARPAAPPTR
jgi:hypothetical protein